MAILLLISLIILILIPIYYWFSNDTDSKDPKWNENVEIQFEVRDMSDVNIQEVSEEEDDENPEPIGKHRLRVQQRLYPKLPTMQEQDTKTQITKLAPLPTVETTTKLYPILDIADDQNNNNEPIQTEQTLPSPPNKMVDLPPPVIVDVPAITSRIESPEIVEAPSNNSESVNNPEITSLDSKPLIDTPVIATTITLDPPATDSSLPSPVDNPIPTITTRKILKNTAVPTSESEPLKMNELFNMVVKPAFKFESVTVEKPNSIDLERYYSQQKANLFNLTFDYIVYSVVNDKAKLECLEIIEDLTQATVEASKNKTGNYMELEREVMELVIIVILGFDMISDNYLKTFSLPVITYINQYENLADWPMDTYHSNIMYILLHYIYCEMNSRPKVVNSTLSFPQITDIVWDRLFSVLYVELVNKCVRHTQSDNFIKSVIQKYFNPKLNIFPHRFSRYIYKDFMRNLAITYKEILPSAPLSIPHHLSSSTVMILYNSYGFYETVKAINLHPLFDDESRGTSGRIFSKASDADVNRNQLKFTCNNINSVKHKDYLFTFKLVLFNNKLAYKSSCILTPTNLYQNITRYIFPNNIINLLCIKTSDVNRVKVTTSATTQSTTTNNLSIISAKLENSLQYTLSLDGSPPEVVPLEFPNGYKIGNDLIVFIYEPLIVVFESDTLKLFVYILQPIPSPITTLPIGLDALGVDNVSVQDATINRKAITFKPALTDARNVITMSKAIRKKKIQRQ
ncbi:MAG: hypothetical protein ACRYGG_09000 [Janthinobacterium lividum]